MTVPTRSSSWLQPVRTARGLARRSTVRRALGYDEVIYLVGPTGNPNYGDELIAATWLRYLARERPNATVVLDCHSPGQASLLLRGIHPRLVVVDTLWKMVFFADAGSGDIRTEPHEPQPWEWVAAAACDPGAAPRLAEGIDLLGRASTIHLIGGGYLNSIWPHHVSLFVAAAAVATRTGANAVATGQGLVPAVEGPALAALTAAAKQFAVLDVRDEASAHVITGAAGLRHSGDDAWLALNDPARTLYRAETDSRVVLCLQSDLTDDFGGPHATGTQALADFVGATLDAWAVTGDQVTVIEAIPGHDYEVPELMGDRLAGAQVMPFQDVWRHGLPASDATTWISTRFHPHLLAAANGAAGVAISSMPGYYSTKHQSLVDTGSRWTLVTDGMTIPSRPEAHGFAAADRERAIAAKLATAREIYPRSLVATPQIVADWARTAASGGAGRA